MTHCTFYFIFKNVLFFTYYTEQNTKDSISLRRCYVVTKTKKKLSQLVWQYNVSKVNKLK